MGKKNSTDIWRVLLIYVLVLLFAVAVVVRVFVLQVADREKYEEIARKNEIRVDTVEAKRGNVYSKDGELLAVSVPRYDIYYDYSNVDDKVFDANVSALADSLSKAFKQNSKSYYEKILREAQQTKGSKYVSVIKGLKYEECKRVKGFPIFNQGNVVSVDRVMVRELPYGELAMRTIGYVREKDHVILSMLGIEGQFDSYLRGKAGVQMSRRLNGGIFIPIPSQINTEPVDGCDVYTSIDANLQEIVEDALYKGLVNTKVEDEDLKLKGCAVVMNVETGFVEAMANLYYDKETKEFKESNNFAIGEGQEPGSTFKAVVMTALLENNPNLNINRVLDVGTKKEKYIHTRPVEDSHVINVTDGKVTIERGFWESSNIVFAMLADEAFGDNPEKFVECIKKTKINEPLHLELMEYQSNPSIGLDNSSQKNKVSSMISMSFGYALRISPITLCTFYNGLANNGKMLKPQFVREIRRGDEVVKKFEPIVINERLASEENISIIQGLLRGVTENGTAKKIFKGCAIPVAGKTGTAHRCLDSLERAKLNANNPGKKRSYDDKRYVATFAGFFPADNPKYSCVVMIADPNPKKHYGVDVSAPVFREIADRVYATSLGIKESTDVYPSNCDKYMNASMAYFQDVVDYCDVAGLKIVDKEFGTEWVKVGKAKNDGITIENVDTKYGVVPDFKGMNVTDAVYLIESMGWTAEFTGRGMVVDQSVKAGTELEKGKIVLKLDNR